MSSLERLFRDLARVRDPARAVAERARPEAIARGDAVLVGSLSGVVEWTNSAWTQLTGFPLAETVGKPIAHFLEHAGIEAELVDLVGHQFREGRACSALVSYPRPGAGAIDVHLEVEPILGRDGEIERFVAVATKVTPATPPATRRTRTRVSPPDATDATRVRPGASTTAPGSRSNGACDVSRAARRALGRLGRDRMRDWIVDTALTPDLPAAGVDGSLLERLLALLLRAALDAPPGIGDRHLTVLTGVLRPGRSHHSEVHPIPQRATARLEAPHVFVELHDTAISTTDPGREVVLAQASAACRSLGGALLLDDRHGCGRQVLVALPAARAARERRSGS